MNEFEWEKQLRESDQLTDKYMRLVDKYGDSPEAQKQIAKEMGWNWLVEALEGEKTGEPCAAPDEEFDPHDYDEPEPDPATEGKDWIRDDDGEIRHPLALLAQLHAMALWQVCDSKGLLGEDSDPDLHEMVFESQVLAAKLAGALDSFSTRPDLEDAGFIVACLKRALLPLNRGLAATEKVAGKALLEPVRIEATRSALFGIREKMLELMQRYRQQAGPES
jgi:hypothetical protein